MSVSNFLHEFKDLVLFHDSGLKRLLTREITVHMHRVLHNLVWRMALYKYAIYPYLNCFH